MQAQGGRGTGGTLFPGGHGTGGTLAPGGHGAGGTVTQSSEGCSPGCPLTALRPYFIQGRGGDDSYDPFVATATVLGLLAQIVASVLKMRDGTDVETLCVGGEEGVWLLTVGGGQGCVSRTCLW